MFKLSKDSSIILDLIRSISAQIVLLGHGLSLLNIYPLKSDGNPFYMQNLGVLIFFILSGLLISYSTINKKLTFPQYNYKKYFLDRFVRIYSAYLPALLLVLVLDLLYIEIYGAINYKYWDAFNAKTFFANLFMFQDFPFFSILYSKLKSVSNQFEFLKITSFGSARPFWTLAIEWWFYLFFGLLFFWKEIKINILLKITFLMIVLIVPVFNTLEGRGNGLTIIWYIGVLMFFIFTTYKTQHSFRQNLLFAGVLIVLSFLRLQFNEFEVYDLVLGCLISLTIYFLICAFNKKDILNNELLNNIIKKTADYSFTLYLIHYTLIEFFTPYVGRINSTILLFASFIVCNLVSFLVAYFTEYRYRELKKWLEIKLKL